MSNTVSLDIIAVDSASNILRSIGSEFGALGQVAVAALGLATGAFTSLLEAGSSAQDTMARFNSLVDASPLANTKDEMLALADVTAKKTRYDNDSILAAEGQLAVYTNISEKVFPDALKATVNLATYMQSDAPAAAKTLGRALEDIGNGSLSLLYKQKLLTDEQKKTAEGMEAHAGSAAAYQYELDNVSDSVQAQVLKLQAGGKNVEAYKLVWDNLGDAQRKTASEMRNTNGDAAAQAYVIDILNGKIGNLAEDMGKDFPGQIEILQNKLGDFWQEQGSKTETVLQPLIGWFNILADEAMPKVGEALDYMRGGLNKVVDTFGLLMNGQLTVSDIFSDIGKSITSIDWGDIGQSINDGITKGLEIGKGALLNTEKFGSNLLKQVEDSAKSIDWQSLSTTVANGINSIDWNFLGSQTGKGASALGGWWDAQMKTLESIVAHTNWSSIFDSVKKAIDSFIGGAIGGLPGAVQSAVKAAVNAFIPLDGAIQTAIDLVNSLISAFASVGGPGAAMGPNKPFLPNGPFGGSPYVPTGVPPAGYGHAAGADFIVPPGFPNDSYPLRVESGERVQVTPAGQAGTTAQVAPLGSGGVALHNTGTINIHIHSDKPDLSQLMSEMGAAM